jgi:hypothetical protein
MTLDDLLSRLEGVRQRGSGWMAKCPAHHPDTNPSLSIDEGDRGILLHCFTGCTKPAICAALGVQVRDLFFDSGRPDPRARQEAQSRRAQKARTHAAADVTFDALREAERFIRSRQGLDISGWSDQRLDDELNALAAAYTILESEGLNE